MLVYSDLCAGHPPPNPPKNKNSRQTDYLLCTANSKSQRRKNKERISVPSLSLPRSSACGDLRLVQIYRYICLYIHIQNSAFCCYSSLTLVAIFVCICLLTSTKKNSIFVQFFVFFTRFLLAHFKFLDI